MSVLPMVLLALGAWMLSSLTSQSGFVMNSATPRSKVAMRGFKDDFYAWKDTLSSEDQALLLKQAQNESWRLSVLGLLPCLGEFNKKFRASDEFKKSVSEDKIESFGKVAYDFSLKRAVIEVDRDADRRWSFATDKMKLAEDKDGERFEKAAKIKKMLDGFEIPAAGEDFAVKLPRKLIDDLNAIAGGINAQMEGKSESELDEMWWKEAGKLVAGYYKQREEVEKDVEGWAISAIGPQGEGLKKFFRSQKDMPGKTKADIVKQIWAELPKHMDTPVAPLDEEMLVDLAKEPAVIEGEFKHSWGTAEKLYKSEAIDSFGNRYLLGVFENKADAEKAFDSWNKEYEQAGKDVKENLKNWAKQQEAELAEEQDSVDRIRKALEEARR
eukprot:s988_g13.t1